MKQTLVLPKFLKKINAHTHNYFAAVISCYISIKLCSQNCYVLTQLAFIEEINTLNQAGVFRVSTLKSTIVSARRPQIDKGRKDVGLEVGIKFCSYKHL